MTYSMQQISKAGKQVLELMTQEGLEDHYIGCASCAIHDLIDVLDGRLRPFVAKEYLLHPEYGFVPVVGEVSGDGKIEYYQGDDHA